MTPSPDLTPEQDAVRRLLAEARHDEPVPPEVVARLDDVLASLHAERATDAGTAPVVDLTARRRRLVGAGVMAAAAVVVAGVALGQVLPQGASDSDSSTASTADEGGSAEDSGTDGGGDAAAESTTPQERSGKAAAPPVPQVSLDADLDEQLTSLRSDSRRPATLSADPLVTCQVGEVGRGRQVLVQVDGRPGLVVFGPVGVSGQETDVYLCGDPEPVRTLTLPLP